MTDQEPSERDRLLTSWEQFRSEVFKEPLLPDVEIQELAKQAHSGNEEAKELFVKQCLRSVIYESSRYTQFVYNYDEHMDLIGAANERIVKVLDQALSKQVPAAYLRVVIRSALVNQSVYYQRFVKQNVSLERLGLDEHPVAKMQLSEPEEHPEMHRVREALNSLTEKQRYVVLRHFGLDGNAPESLSALSKRMSSTGNDTKIARDHLQNALNRLQHLLNEKGHSTSPRLDTLETHEGQRELAQEAQAVQKATFNETLEHYKDEIPKWIEEQDRLDTTVREPFHDHDIDFDR